MISYKHYPAPIYRYLHSPLQQALISSTRGTETLARAARTAHVLAGGVHGGAVHAGVAHVPSWGGGRRAACAASSHKRNHHHHQRKHRRGRSCGRVEDDSAVVGDGHCAHWGGALRGAGAAPRRGGGAPRRGGGPPGPGRIGRRCARTGDVKLHQPGKIEPSVVGTTWHHVDAHGGVVLTTAPALAAPRTSVISSCSCLRTLAAYPLLPPTAPTHTSP